MTIEAEVICDSISPVGKQLTTMRLRYPKFIHGEAKTHRVLRLGNEGGYVVLEQEVGFMDDPNFSRNASSSRAVPTAKLIEEVRSDALRAAPVFWGKNQPGMQAAEENWRSVFLYENPKIKGIGTFHNNGEDDPCWQLTAKEAWKEAAYRAAEIAEALADAGYHKQIVNRILEPFLHINVVVTATEWDNFFGLRLHKAAQPEMRALAEAMWQVKQASKPQLTKPGDWHLPFCTLEGDTGDVRDIDQPAVRAYAAEHGLEVVDVARSISVARCARVSYSSFETGKRSSVEEDIKLAQFLMTSGHWSPFEHQATPDEKWDWGICLSCEEPVSQWCNYAEHGNFVGWRQYRKMQANEAVAELPEEYR